MKRFLSNFFDKQKNNRFLTVTIFAVVLVVPVILFIVINHEISRRMELFKIQIISSLEAQLGYKIAYESISPSFFMYIEIRNLKIIKYGLPDQELFRLNRVRIYYNLLLLLTKRDPLLAVSEINVRNTIFRYDTERDRKFIDFIQSLPPLPQPVPYNIKLTGSNVHVDIYYENMEVKARNIFFTIESLAELFNFNLHRAFVSVAEKKDGETSHYFSSRVEYSGNINRSLDKIDSQFKLNTLTNDVITLKKPQVFQLTLKENNLEIVKIKDRSQLDLKLFWEKTTNHLRLSFKSEKLVPLEQLEFTEKYNAFNEWLKLQLTSGGDLSYELANNSLRYEINVNARLANKLLPAEMELVSTLSGDEKSVDVRPLSIKSSIGSLYFVGDVLYENLFPQGMLKLIKVRSYTGASIDAAIKIERKPEKLQLEGVELIVGTTGFKSFLLNIHPSRHNMHFNLHTELANMASSNHLQATGSLTLQPELNLAVQCELSDIPASHIYNLFIPKEQQFIQVSSAMSSLLTNTTLDLKTDFTHFQLSSSGIQLQDADNPENFIFFPLFWDNHDFLIDSYKAVWHRYTSSGTLDVSFINQQETEFSATVKVEDRDYYFKGSYHKTQGLRCTGPYDFNCSFQRENGKYSFNFQTREFPFPLKQQTVYASFNLQGFYTNTHDWFLYSPNTYIKNLPLFDVKENSTIATFLINPSLIDINYLRYTDRFSSLFGNGKFAISLAENTIHGSLALKNYTKKENYTLDLHLDSQRLNLMLDFQNFPVNRQGLSNIYGKLDGQLRVYGSPADPIARLYVNLANGRINTEPLLLSAKFLYYRQIVYITTLDTTYLGNRLQNFSGVIDLRKQNFEFNTELRTEYFNYIHETELKIEGQLNRPDIARDDFFPPDLNASIYVTNRQLNQEKLADWQIDLQLANKNLYFAEALTNSFNGVFRNDGKFELELNNSLPLKVSAKGLITDNKIEAQLNQLEIDMSILNPFIGDGIVAFKQGKIKGDLRITGLLNDPDFYGTLFVQESILWFYLCPNMTQPMNTLLVFEGKAFYMKPVNTLAGSTPLTATASFLLGHWQVLDFEVNVLTPESTGLHIFYDFGPLFINGFAKGRVNVKGGEKGTWITGKLFVSNCKLTIGDEKKETEYREIPRELALFIDLDFEADKQTEFLWPTFNFPIVRTTLDLGSKIQYIFNGDAMEVLVKGDVSLKGGDVFYFGRNFYIKEGSIIFDETLENFDPRVSLRAEIRERDEQDEEVIIYLVVNNRRLSEFEPRFESAPSRTEIEIIALLGGPIQHRIEESGPGLSALILSTDLASQMGIVRPFEQKVREVLGLDLFTIRTQVIQNLFLTKFLGIEEDPVNRGPDNIARYLDNTTITFGKYIGKDIFVEALINFNQGPNYEVDTDFLMSIEFPTPFFNLKWSVSPNFTAWDEFIVPENIVTFSWRYSF